MHRSLEANLVTWKDAPLRKPLILRGARQVGKTWLVKDFGRRHFKHVAICNLDRDVELREAFQNKSPQRIIPLLEMIFGYKFLPGETLLFFDEVQDCPEALNSLKYFFEERRDLHVVAAGSLLGVLLARHSYPVGTVDLLDLYPLDFAEYLAAIDPLLHQSFLQLPLTMPTPEFFHRRLLDAYHNYLIIGGMPECVATWERTRDPAAVYQVQNTLLKFYEGDFGKHLGEIAAAKCLLIFRSLPGQLAKENEKFVFGAVRKGARARDLEDAIRWNVSAGLVSQVHNLTKIESPLRAFRNDDVFKLFLLDVGLLKTMAGVANKAIVLSGDYQFKGPMAENYLLQQLTGKLEVEPFYFADQVSREIDFMLQAGTEVIPVEVKGGRNTKAISLKNYLAKHHPPLALRLSEHNVSRTGDLLDMPLYFAPRLPELLNKFS